MKLSKQMKMKQKVRREIAKRIEELQCSVVYLFMFRTESVQVLKTTTSIMIFLDPSVIFSICNAIMQLNAS